MARIRRMDRTTMILAAVGAAVGLTSLAFSVVWLVAMLESPELTSAEIGVAWAAVGACVASVVMVLVIPVFDNWEPSAVPLTIMAVLFGLLGLVAAFGIWIASLIVVCDVACRPVDTWKEIPVLLTCAAMAALGVVIVAKAKESEGWWTAAAVVAGIAFVVGIGFWVEQGVYAG